MRGPVRLRITGLDKRYKPQTAGTVTGFELTLIVVEDTQLTPVILDIPGIEAEQAWRALRSVDPLIDHKIPGSEQASQRYLRAIERWLAEQKRPEKIEQKLEADLATGAMTVFFRPVNLPKIGGLEFSGNTSVTTDALRSVLGETTLGREYTEYSFRRSLELNVRPVYEESGRLRVAFPSISLAKGNSENDVVVTTSIREGEPCVLGQVALSGERVDVEALMRAANFPLKKLANWKVISQSLSNMEQLLRRDGYLNPSVKVERVFDDTEHIVNLAVQIQKGDQFFFGDLKLAGLSPLGEKAARGLWRLPGGAPLNQPYIDEFLRAVFKDPNAKGSSSVGMELRLRPNTRIIDVIVTFR